MQNQPDPIGQTAAQLKAAGQSTLQVVATVAVLLYQQRQNAHNELKNMQRLQDQALGAQKMYNAVKKMFGREYDKAAASFNQVYSPNFWAKTNEKEVIEKYAQASFWAQYKPGLNAPFGARCFLTFALLMPFVDITCGLNAPFGARCFLTPNLTRAPRHSRPES